MKNLGSFTTISTNKSNTVNLSNLKKGVNDIANHFIKVADDGKIEYVIDKVCNHAGGKLILKGEKAICPMHDWQLNLDTLKYSESHVCKEKASFHLDDSNNIHVNDSIKHLVNPFKGIKKGTVKIRWLNHATVYIECNGKSVITDPWLFGPAFMTGWWLATPSPEESIDLLKKADYVYISHNHPDHLHAETLAVLSKDKEIIVADFSTKSTEKYLRALGYENVKTLPFNEIFEIVLNFQICIFKSGDFRDDSGIYFCVNGHEILLTVDANLLNQNVLPKGIDLLMTSFAGGASGFPLCFENFTEEEKKGVLKRNKNAVKISVNQYLQSAAPKFYMPYAGMFQEYSYRDKYILEMNDKNSDDEFELIAQKNNATYIKPSSEHDIIFDNGVLLQRAVKTKYLEQENSNFYVEKLKKEFPFDCDKVVEYLCNSGFKGNQILQIIPTDDDFELSSNTIIYADFSNGAYKSIPSTDLIVEMEGFNVMQLKIRQEVLMCIIENKLPWEDFSIGFQMRVKRVPNHYESDFWYHFTNVYIGGQHFRYSSFCGACTVVNQNPIWIKSMT